MKTTSEYVSPSIAEGWLQKNTCNRPISVAHVGKLAATMTAGHFLHTHQGIAFYDDGYLADGQHRLRAVVKSGCTILMNVTRGVERTASDAIDQQSRGRSLSDSLAMESSDSGRNLVAMARLWLTFIGVHSPANFTIREFIDLHKPELQRAIAIAGSNHHLRHACVCTMMAIGISAGHGDEIEQWAAVVDSGVATLDWQVSAIRFRDFWMTCKRTGGGNTVRKEYASRAFASMRAWIARKPLQKLYAAESIEWLQSSRELSEKQ